MPLCNCSISVECRYDEEHQNFVCQFVTESDENGGVVISITHILSVFGHLGYEKQLGQLKIWMASLFSDQVALRANGIFGLRKTPVGGTKVCSRLLGHMTKMAATPIYGKNPSKIFFSRTGGPISMKLGMQHLGLQPIIVCSNDDPGLTLTYFTARLKVTQAFLQEKVKTVDFSETFVASDLKVGRSRHLNEFMKVSIEGQ